MDDQNIVSGSSTNDFNIGDVVFEKYEILCFIAAGGGGRVYKAHDNFRNLDVAIKVLLVDQNDQKAHVRFQSEAKTASKLSHPNIATIFDFGLSKGKPFLIMEFVNGQSLHDMLESADTLDLDSFKDIFIQVARAVHHAHQSNIVHRDLKPANIIVSTTADGNLKPKILDFGIAKSLGTEDDDAGKLTMTGAIVGSPLYMSPEQAAGHSVTLESDLYSLGAIMYRCLAGRPPIQGESAMETILLVSNSTPPSIFDVAKTDELPLKLCELVDKLLSKDPNQRPPLSSVVIPTLESIGEHSGQSVTPKADTEYGATTDIRRRNNILPIIIVLVLICFCVVGTVVGFNPLRSSQSDEKTSVVRESAGLADDESLAKIVSVVDDNIKDETNVTLKITNAVLARVEPPAVSLKDSDLIDGDLAKIRNPERFAVIDVARTKVSSLTSVKRFTQLQSLEAGGIKLDVGALKNLKTLSLLTRIDLSNTSFGDNDLEDIKNLKQLKLLNISDTKVTSTGIKGVSQFPRLNDLTLMRCGFEKKDIEPLVNYLPPFCSVMFDFNDSSEKYILELIRKYPDLCINELAGATFTDLEIAEDLLTLPATDSKCEQARFRLKNIIAGLNQRYGNNSSRSRYPYKELGVAEMQLGNYIEASKAFKTAAQLCQENKDVNLQAECMTSLILSMNLSKSDLHSIKDLIVESTKSIEEVYGPNTSIAMSYQISVAANCKNNVTCCDISLPILQKMYKLEKAKARPAPRELAYLQANMGDCYYWLHQPDQAKRSYASAANIFSKFMPDNERDFLMQVMCFRAPTELALSEGKLQVARTLNAQALALCKSSKFRSELTRNLMQEIMKQKDRIQALSK